MNMTAAEFEVTAFPHLTCDSRKEIEFIDFQAICASGERRDWRADKEWLMSLFNILERPDLAGGIVGELSVGNSVILPGVYSPVQLIRLGYRMKLSVRKTRVSS